MFIPKEVWESDRGGLFGLAVVMCAMIAALTANRYRAEPESRPPTDAELRRVLSAHVERGLHDSAYRLQVAEQFDRVFGDDLRELIYQVIKDQNPDTLSRPLIAGEVRKRLGLPKREPEQWESQAPELEVAE